jgi:hypothetical protein
VKDNSVLGELERCLRGIGVYRGGEKERSESGKRIGLDDKF